MTLLGFMAASTSPGGSHVVPAGSGALPAALATRTVVAPQASLSLPPPPLASPGSVPADAGAASRLASATPPLPPTAKRVRSADSPSTPRGVRRRSGPGLSGMMSPPRSHLFPSPPLAPVDATQGLARHMRELNLASPRAQQAGDLAVPSVVEFGARSGSGSSTGTANGRGAGGGLPVFHDHVKRSSRFTTTVPATEILTRVADILATPAVMGDPQRADGSTFILGGGADGSAGDVPIRTHVSWEEYRLDVVRGGVHVCTVQVYLVKAGLYMVDFQRGLMDIFAFKRFYEVLRRQLTAVVKHDYACGTLSALDVLC